MWGLFDILRYSFSSVIWGILIAFAMMALFVFMVRGWWKNALFTPATYICGAILLILLMFQCTMTVGALKIIDNCDRYEAIMNSIVVGGDYLFLDREASPEETNAITSQLVSREPLLQYYISGGWSEGISLRNVPHEMADELRSFMRNYITRRLLWSLAFVLVLGFIAIKTLDTNTHHRTKTHVSRETSRISRDTRRVGRRSRR